jgi:hypothetical protein
MVDEQIASGSLDKTETIGSRWLMKMQRRESLYVLYGTTYEAILSKKKNSLLFHGPLLDVSQPGGKKTLT